MTVYVLLIAYFLSNGTVMTAATVTYTKAICESAISPIAVAMTGKKFQSGLVEVTIVDVQGQCLRVTKAEHA